jgi:hypothetical protein
MEVGLQINIEALSVSSKTYVYHVIYKTGRCSLKRNKTENGLPSTFGGIVGVLVWVH